MTVEMNDSECQKVVYAEGESAGIYDLPKDEAERLRVELTEKTGRLHDWHYVGGRVHMLALPEGHELNPGIKEPTDYGSEWA